MVVIIGISSIYGYSRDIYIPDDYPNIQDAIGVSENGDSIIVRPGTYMENIDFLGKAVLVKSEKGANVTFIDGGNPSNPDYTSTVIFKNQEGSDSRIEGFSIINGTGSVPTYTYGGGVYCLNASPVITRNRIYNNYSYRGGGIGCDNNSFPVIEDNIIENNIAEFGGGGIACYANSNAIISKNVIKENNANGGTMGGGAIHCYGASPKIIKNNIIDNYGTVGGGIKCDDDSYPVIAFCLINNNMSGNGGGISIQRSSPIIYSCKITYNTGEYGAGGIGCIYDSRPIIICNRISCNSVTQQGGSGGGIYCNNNVSPQIIANMISENSAYYSGGGICLSHLKLSGFSIDVCNNMIYKNTAQRAGGVDNSLISTYDVTYANNTIIYNTAEASGGGFYSKNDSIIGNSIIWGNTAYEGNQIYEWSGTASVSYSNIEGGWPGTGNIDSDPLLVDIENGDCHLTWDSPCRNSGSNDLINMLTDDFEGDPRISDDVVDMGADEFASHLYYLGYMTPGDISRVIVQPGETGTFRVTGLPNEIVFLGMGTGYSLNPQSTPYGDFYMRLPLAQLWNLGTIPQTGVLDCPTNLPANWISGDEYPFQAILGRFGNPGTQLTNLLCLDVD